MKINQTFPEKKIEHLSFLPFNKFLTKRNGYNCATNHDYPINFHTNLINLDRAKFLKIFYQNSPSCNVVFYYYTITFSSCVRKVNNFHH